jgi:cell division protein FtsZ
MKGARGVLINITGGQDMTLFEVDEAANRIGQEVDPDANIIFGSTMDPSIEGKMRVSVVATGIDAIAETEPRPVLKVYSAPQKLNRTQQSQAPAEENQTAREPMAATTLTPAMDAPLQPLQTTHPAAASPLADRPVPPSMPQASRDASTSISSLNSPTAEDVVDTSGANLSPTANETTATSLATENPAEAAQPISPVPVVATRPPIELPERPEPRLIRKNDAFMPPAAANPNTIGQADTSTDPFKEADLVNGGTADKLHRKGPNFFQRITGSAREPKPEAEIPSSSIATPVTPNGSSIRQETHADTPRQTSLADVNPEDRVKKPQSDEDLLEIPAFLRRQAN